MHNQPIPNNRDTNPPLLENGYSTLVDTQIPTPPEPNCKHIITHAAEVKFINNYYTAPVTIEFGSTDSESIVNTLVKYRKIFATIKFLDPSATIKIQEKIIIYPGELPMGT